MLLLSTTKLLLLSYSIYLNSATKCPFKGVIVGGTNKRFDITVNYGRKEFHGQTDANGQFAVEIGTGRSTSSNNDGTIRKLSVEIRFNPTDGTEIQRTKHWHIAKMKCQNWHAFHFGQFLPKFGFNGSKPSLFLRAKFSSNFPKPNADNSFVLRLGHMNTEGTFSTMAQLATKDMAKWKWEGVKLKLDEKGIKWVQRQTEPTLRIELIEVKLEVCSFCTDEFHKKKMAQKVAGCQHFYHSCCVNKWLKTDNGIDKKCWCGTQIKTEENKPFVALFDDTPITERSLFRAVLRMPVLQNGDERQEDKFAYKLDEALVNAENEAKMAQILDAQTLKVIKFGESRVSGSSRHSSEEIIPTVDDHFNQYQFNEQQQQQMNDAYYQQQQPLFNCPSYGLPHMWEDIMNANNWPNLAQNEQSYASSSRTHQPPADGDWQRQIPPNSPAPSAADQSPFQRVADYLFGNERGEAPTNWPWTGDGQSRSRQKRSAKHQKLTAENSQSDSEEYEDDGDEEDDDEDGKHKYDGTYEKFLLEKLKLINAEQAKREAKRMAQSQKEKAKAAADQQKRSDQLKSDQQKRSDQLKSDQQKRSDQLKSDQQKRSDQLKSDQKQKMNPNEMRREEGQSDQQKNDQKKEEMDNNCTDQQNDAKSEEKEETKGEKWEDAEKNLSEKDNDDQQKRVAKIVTPKRETNYYYYYSPEEFSSDSDDYFSDEKGAIQRRKTDEEHRKKLMELNKKYKKEKEEKEGQKRKKWGKGEKVKIFGGEKELETEERSSFDEEEGKEEKEKQKRKKWGKGVKKEEIFGTEEKEEHIKEIIVEGKDKNGKDKKEKGKAKKESNWKDKEEKSKI